MQIIGYGTDIYLLVLETVMWQQKCVSTQGVQCSVSVLIPKKVQLLCQYNKTQSMAHLFPLVCISMFIDVFQSRGWHTFGDCNACLILLTKCRLRRPRNLSSHVSVCYYSHQNYLFALVPGQHILFTCLVFEYRLHSFIIFQTLQMHHHERNINQFKLSRQPLTQLIQQGA